jgi:hypothetical protein
MVEHRVVREPMGLSLTDLSERNGRDIPIVLKQTTREERKKSLASLFH